MDITRELTGAPVYPGDPAPVLTPLCRIAYGDACNTTQMSACLHNGTHMDAPLHFVEGGADIASVSLSACIGPCSVVELSGELTGQQLERLLPRLERRVLIKGTVELTPSAAFVLTDSGTVLLGVEPQSVSMGQTAAVHRQLLGSGMVLLEGLDLSQVDEGRYFLVAAPLKIAGADGAPVRALLARDSVEESVFAGLLG